MAELGEQIFHIVDVFAETRLAGNQLAVFLDGHPYSDAEMQQLAAEMHFSETTFIFPRDSAGTTFRVRIFTPAAELPFAGHPTLGTAYILARECLPAPVDEVTLDLPAGRIPVRLAYDGAGTITRLTMQQLPPTFGATLDPAPAAAMLRLDAADLDPTYPAQTVSTGVPFLILPLRTLDAVRRARPDLDRLGPTLAGVGAGGVEVFCREVVDAGHDLHARVFVPGLGVPEDPATGSAAGCLTGYLLQHRYFGDSSFAIQMEQGYEMGRPSLLYLSGALQDGAFRIEVGGRVQPVARGTLV